MNIKGLNFVCTCQVCPEQYDVYDKNKKQVGYVRLRWGGLRCDYPDCGGETIYRANFEDGLMGCFESDCQRMKHLNNIADKILEKIDS